MVSVLVSENFGIEKSIGIGFGKIWYRKKYWYRFRKFLASKTVSGVGRSLKPKILKPIFFSIPKIFKTDTKFSETDTFFDTKNFRNRYRYFFRYQIFPKPIPILFSIPKFSETDTDTIKKNQKVSKPRSFETEMPNSVSDALFIYCGGVGRTRGGGVSKSEFLWFSNGHILLLLHFLAVVLIVIIVGVEFIRIYSNIFIVEYIRIRIRLIFSNRIYSYSYSVFIFESNIFVFIFGFYF